VTSDVRGKLKDWMLVSPGFFIVTIAQSFASDNCVCHDTNTSQLDNTNTRSSTNLHKAAKDL